MQMQCIQIGNLSVNIPQGFALLNRMPDDPPDMVAYGMQGKQYSCMLFAQPIPLQHAMPFDDCQQIVHGIHDALEADQGLIEVMNGTTDSGKPCVWSIVKTVTQQEGSQYCLTMHIAYSDCALWMQLLTGELGTTGMRDATMFEIARRNGWVDGQGNGWMQDPYDKSYIHGIRMNIGEDRQFDDMFPEHPLSVMRNMHTLIVGCN